MLSIFSKILPREKIEKMNNSDSTELFYEYCPRCNANLQLQKGFNPYVSRWLCRGCGEILYRPDSDEAITWICDECEVVLNDQEGFNEDCAEWKCTKCGFVNQICESEIYLSEDEFQEAKKNPLRGLSNEDVIRLSYYEDIEYFEDREDIIIVKNIDTEKRYLKKYLRLFNESIYQYIFRNPVKHIPRIIDIFKAKSHLIVIEEYVEGKTIESVLEEGLIEECDALDIAEKLCTILLDLQNEKTPIVHRDIKPSNVLLTENNEVYLIDLNVAKWIDNTETEDTQMLGTQYYAAPEQYGFGKTGSSDKTDIYALGMLLNKMITGKFPKECRVESPIGDLIDKCTNLNPDNRYNAKELKNELIRMKGCK